MYIPAQGSGAPAHTAPRGALYYRTSNDTVYIQTAGPTGATWVLFGATDHGALTGLADDDHTQYHNDTRGDARYTQKSNNLSDVADVQTSRNNILPSKTGNALKVLRVNAGETDYELAAASGGIGGSTGAVNERILVADGVGGSTLKAAPVTIDASGNFAGMGTIDPSSVNTGVVACTSIELGHASDTTLARISAGNIGVEGNLIYRAGGTDVPITDGGTGASTAAGAFANLKQAASDTDTGVVELAIQSEMEAGADTARAVVPGRQHYHPSAAKFWVDVSVSGGTPSISASYNVTSITDTATGQLTVTIATDFSSADWACLLTTEDSNSGSQTSGVRNPRVQAGFKTAGTVVLLGYDDTATTQVLRDPAGWHIVGFGDQ